MKNTINDLAATNAVSWGSIAEKIDENFKELEDSIPEGGGLDETKLKEYLESNEYVKKDDIPSNKKQISILFVGNSLTQDGIAYLPYMLKTYYPEVDFKIYMWYKSLLSYFKILLAIFNFLWLILTSFSV